MSVRILRGDCREVLPTLPDGSVHCCVSSPPYWGLRDYGVAGQIGLEESVDIWVAELVAVFREVRRVLRDDGTCWINLGDSYATGTTSDRSITARGKHGYWQNPAVNKRIDSRSMSLKPKDLIGQPWLVAFALRADGWYLRQEIIWAKPNPMPESVTDRCTKAHEQIFLLSKSPRYFFDFAAMQEPVNGGAHARVPGNVRPSKGQSAIEAGDERHRTKAGLLAYADRQCAKYKTPDGWDTRTGHGGHGSFHAEGREAGKVRADPNVGRRYTKLADAGSGIKYNDSFSKAMAGMTATRNKRSVWTVASQPFSDSVGSVSHFATFPPALIEPCIRAGCPPGGVVLDPFGGAGTTGLVADCLQRNAILIELNPAYAAMADVRITNDAPLFAEIAA